MPGSGKPGRGALHFRTMDNLVLLWIPFGLVLIVAAVAMMFVVMRFLA